jgi:type IV secretion system protein VirB2
MVPWQPLKKRDRGIIDMESKSRRRPFSSSHSRNADWQRTISLVAVVLFLMPVMALAQQSPFLTGASALQTNILAWLTPVAIILVMVLGGMAMANRMSWGWCIGAIIGIAIAFGAPQIVTWVRGMFGV